MHSTSCALRAPCLMCMSTQRLAGKGGAAVYGVVLVLGCEQQSLAMGVKGIPFARYFCREAHA